MIGKDKRPLDSFGSTSPPGDDRALPLRFDFGKGMFGFFAPMEAPGKLAAVDEIQNLAGPPYLWMKNHRTGYHYWAGIYNNQNTYLAPWFRQAHGNEEDVWMKLADGKLFRSSSVIGASECLERPCARLHSRLLRNPGANPEKRSVSSLLRLYCRASSVGRATARARGFAQYSGYNDSSIRSFREFLRKKFGSIKRLNRAWQADYTQFDSIQPPPILMFTLLQSDAAFL